VFALNLESESVNVEGLTLLVIGDSKCWIYILHFFYPITALSGIGRPFKIKVAMFSGARTRIFLACVFSS
jgi:hypothetical protein